MKKAILIFVCIIFVFGLTACGATNPQAESVTVSVDSTYEGNAGGTNSNGEKTFKTINEAITYLNSANLGDTEKTIKLSAGEYNERFSVPATLKNLTIIGAGVGTTRIYNNVLTGNITTYENALAVINVYADGFKMSGVFVENTYPYNTDFSTNQKQGLVILADADQVIFYDCHFKSYQDTIYNVHGRQYFEKCVIEGCVDFICGNNAPTYFNNCTINSVVRRKADGTIDSNGGYITAYRGTNDNDDENVPTYGYILNNCTMTSETGVVLGSVALGRPWRKNAVVAFLNCDMGEHISTKAYYNGKTSKVRYVQMGGMNLPDGTQKVNKPFEASFKEFNNTGKGSVSDLTAYYQTRSTGLVTDYLGNTPADSDDFKMLTVSEAENYNITNIFAKTNGGVSFSSDWNATNALNSFIVK